MDRIGRQLVAPATVEPRDGIAGMDGDIVRRIVTRLAVDEQLPIGRIILGRTQLNTVVLKAQNEGARSNGVNVVRLECDLVRSSALEPDVTTYCALSTQV